MTPERYSQLMNAAMVGEELNLTPGEVAKGWHWCWEWDGLLVGPNMGEMQFCQCQQPEVKLARRRWKWYWKIKWFWDGIKLDYWYPCSECGKRFGRHDKSIPHLPF